MLGRLLALQGCLRLIQVAAAGQITEASNRSAIAAATKTFGVADAETLVATLEDQTLGQSLADLASLDTAETAELAEKLAAAGVPLGDRSRLRRLMASAGRLRLAGSASDDFMLSQFLLSHNYGPEWGRTYTHRDEDANKNSRAASRALQESTTNGSGTMSGDTMALIVAPRAHGEIQG